MKFAVKFYKDCRILPQVDEIIIQYNEKNPNLIKFVQEYKEDQRIVINITELSNIEDNLNIFEAAFKAHPHFAILLSQKQNIADIAEMNIPFFFLEGASCLDDMAAMVNAGVSDLYVINELAFNIVEVSEYCHKKNVSVRVYPNVAQSLSRLNNINSLTKFFVRPDAVQVYSPYVDVMEFFGPLDKQPVLYEIYRDERWQGNLDDIIIGLNKHIDNKTIVPYFDIIRLKCGKVCSFEKCSICSAVEKFGNTLQTKEIGIRKRKANLNGNRSQIDEVSLSAESVFAKTDISNLSTEE